MPIINTNSPDRTQIQKEADAFKGRIAEQWQRDASLAAQILKWVWTSAPRTPQQGFDAFGTDAAELLKFHQAHVAMVYTRTGVMPASPIPAGWALAPNQDGTVTATYTAPAPQ